MISNLTLFNRRILVVFLLIGITVIKKKFLDKSKENMANKCELTDKDDSCSFKNSKNYNESYKNKVYYVIKGFKKDVKSTWRGDSFFIVKPILIIKKYFKYVYYNLYLLMATFSTYKKYKATCYYTCEKNKKQCEKDKDFLNVPIVKNFITFFNNLRGADTPEDIFKSCNLPNGYKEKITIKDVNCCQKKSVYKEYYRKTLISLFLLIFSIFFFIILCIFLNK
tara:strand:- start:763 stop:1431 length:669 start_codon:yes stop_codon:yes gene_type:complete